VGLDELMYRWRAMRRKFIPFAYILDQLLSTSESLTITQIACIFLPCYLSNDQPGRILPRMLTETHGSRGGRVG